MKHASIIPLIGGETIGSMEAFGSLPSYMVTYSPFRDNESHLTNYLKHKGYDVPYVVLDEDTSWRPNYVDSVSSVCPCAGLSFLSSGYGEQNEANKWMPIAAEYVLGQIKPRVYWGENAPHLAGKVGKPVVEKLMAVARKHGYVMSLYRTKSLLHGVPQVRERAFYFFWRGDSVPLLGYFDRPHRPIEDVIAGVRSNFQMEPVNKDTPSRDDPYYRYLLEVIHGGITHRQHHDVMDRERPQTGYLDVKSDIERRGVTYRELAAWMEREGYHREVPKCLRAHDKLERGENIMRRGTMVPKNYIGAFVSHYPLMLTHPYEDRYVTYRESMTIMGMPDDFELLRPRRSINHVCQNVPVQTARDMASEVREFLLGNRRDMIRADLVLQKNHSQTHEVVSGGATAGSLEALI